MLPLNIFFGEGNASFEKNIYIYLVREGVGVARPGEGGGETSSKAIILEEPLFLYCLQTLCQSEHYRNGTSLSIYLPFSFTHRWTNKNDSFKKQHACHFYIFFR